MIIQINQFSSWTTNQLKSWIEGFCLLSDSTIESNIHLCMQAVEELNIREGVYEELEMLY